MRNKGGIYRQHQQKVNEQNSPMVNPSVVGVVCDPVELVVEPQQWACSKFFFLFFFLIMLNHHLLHDWFVMYGGYEFMCV